MDAEEFLNKRRGREFFLLDARQVAESLLGDYLVFMRNNFCLAGKIVETEAYPGVNDRASHSYGNKITLRNSIMYEPGGIIYVYLIYGKFWCFNLVASVKNDPQAVFIRAVEPVMGIEFIRNNRPGVKTENLTNGPGKWTKAFGVNKEFLGRSITGPEIFVAVDKSKIPEIVSAKRVGVDYAGEDKDLPLRFYIKDNRFVSKR